MHSFKLGFVGHRRGRASLKLRPKKTINKRRRRIAAVRHRNCVLSKRQHHQLKPRFVVAKRPSTISQPGLPTANAISGQVNIKSSSRGDHHEVKNLLGSLKNMDPNAQIELWKTMIDNHPFDLDQLMTLHTAIDERIKLDIVSGVPYEIALYIMSFLSPKDLCQAAQTCRSWRTVCEDNRLWREICKEEGLLDNEQTLEVLFRQRIGNRNIKQEQFAAETTSSLMSVSDPKWKPAYLKHMSILRNWGKRKFEISDPFSAPSPKQADLSNQAAEQDQAELANAVPIAGGLISSNASNNSSNSNDVSLRSCASSNGARTNDNCESRPTSRDSDNYHSPNIAKNCETHPPSIHSMQLRCHAYSVITCLQYNSRTHTIVSGSDDQTLKVWSSETGRCLTTLEGHTGGVWSSQLSPDDIVISGSTDRTLRVWKAHSGDLLHTLYGHTSTVRCLALDGKHVVSGSRDTTLRLWDIVKGLCVHVFLGHSAAVRCVEYKNDTIVSGAYDHRVMVWDAITGSCRHVLEKHHSRIYSLQFDGRTIASGSLDSTICIWEAATGKLRHLLEGHKSLTSKMQMGGNLLVSANADTSCKVWNITTGECLLTLGTVRENVNRGDNRVDNRAENRVESRGGHESAMTSVCFNDRHVITASDDGTVKLWDIKTGEFIRDLIVLPTASNGGVVWRIRASYTKLICAVGCRVQTKDTHLLVLDFNE